MLPNLGVWGFYDWQKIKFGATPVSHVTQQLFLFYYIYSGRGEFFPCNYAPTAKTFCQGIGYTYCWMGQAYNGHTAFIERLVWCSTSVETGCINRQSAYCVLWVAFIWPFGCFVFHRHDRQDLSRNVAPEYFSESLLLVYQHVDVLCGYL